MLAIDFLGKKRIFIFSLNDHASSVELYILKWLVYVCILVYYFYLKSFIPFHILFFLIKIIFSCSGIMDIILYI